MRIVTVPWRGLWRIYEAGVQFWIRIRVAEGTAASGFQGLKYDPKRGMKIVWLSILLVGSCWRRKKKWSTARGLNLTIFNLP